MTAPRAEKVYEKHAWIILFVMSLLPFVVGFSYIAGGVARPPNYLVNWPDLTRSEVAPLLARSPSELSLIFGQVLTSWGIFESTFGALGMAISATSFRRGEKWAWYALSIIPIAFAGELANAVMWASRQDPYPSCSG